MVVTTRKRTAARPAAVWQLGPRTENASMAVVPKSNAVNARAVNKLNASKNAAAVMTMMTTKGTTPGKNAVASPHVQRTKRVSMVVGRRKNADNEFGDNKLNVDAVLLVGDFFFFFRTQKKNKAEP